MNDAMTRIASLQVADVMSKQLFWVSRNQRMADVAAQFLKHEISSAPVIDETGFCIGIISATDFLRRDSAALTSVTPAHSGQQAFQADDVAGTYMSTAVQSVPQHVSLLQAAKIMCSQHVHRLPVVDSIGKLVGVVSTMDVTAALVNAMAENELKTS